MTSGQILIVSDDSEFVQSLTARWQAERESPAITAVSTEVSRQASLSGYDLVVLGPLHQRNGLQEALAAPPNALVCAVGDLESLRALRARRADWLLLLEYPGWTQILIYLAREISRRAAAEARMREVENASFSEKRFGILGKSLLEARPGLINALTSLLGNADLILLSGQPLPEECREHVRTIHTMALRLNEIVQRLSSVENEMELGERKSHLETPEMWAAGTPRG